MNKILVDDWKPTKEEEMYLIPDNKLILIPFERIFNHDFGSKTISSFILNTKRFTVIKFIKFVITLTTL